MTNGTIGYRNSAVNLDHIDTPTGMTDWPEFHNGVACGLVIDPRMKEVVKQVILYQYLFCIGLHVFCRRGTVVVS